MKLRFNDLVAQIKSKTKSLTEKFPKSRQSAKKRNQSGSLLPLMGLVTVAGIAVATMVVTTGSSFSSFHKNASTLSNTDTAILATSTLVSNQSNLLLQELTNSLNNSLIEVTTAANQELEEDEEIDLTDYDGAENRKKLVQAYVNFLENTDNSKAIRATLLFGINHQDKKFNDNKSTSNPHDQSSSQNQSQINNEIQLVNLINSNLLKPKVNENDKEYAATIIDPNTVKTKYLSNTELLTKYLDYQGNIIISQKLLESLLGEENAGLVIENSDLFGLSISESGLDISNIPNGVETQIKLDNFFAKTNQNTKNSHHESQSSNANQKPNIITKAATAQSKLITKEVTTPKNPCEEDPTLPGCNPEDPYVECNDGSRIYQLSNPVCFANPYQNGCACYCDVNINCALCGTGCSTSNPVSNNPGGGGTGNPIANPKKPLPLGSGFDLTLNALNTSFLHAYYNPGKSIDANNPIFLTTDKGKPVNRATGFHLDENGNIVITSVINKRDRRPDGSLGKRKPVTFTDSDVSDQRSGSLTPQTINEDGTGGNLGLDLDLTPRSARSFGRTNQDMVVKLGKTKITIPAGSAVSFSGDGDSIIVYNSNGTVAGSYKTSNLPKGAKSLKDDKNRFVDFVGRDHRNEDMEGTNAQISSQFSAADLFPDADNPNKALVNVLSDLADRRQDSVNKKGQKDKNGKGIFKQYLAQGDTFTDKTLTSNLGQGFSAYFDANANHFGNSEALNNFTNGQNFADFLSEASSKFRENSLNNGHLPTQAEMEAFIKKIVMDAATIASNGNPELLETVTNAFDSQATLARKDYVNPTSEALHHNKDEALALLGKAIETRKDLKDEIKNAKSSDEWKALKKHENKIDKLKEQYDGKQLKKKIAKENAKWEDNKYYTDALLTQAKVKDAKSTIETTNKEIKKELRPNYNEAKKDLKHGERTGFGELKITKKGKPVTPKYDVDAPVKVDNIKTLTNKVKAVASTVQTKVNALTNQLKTLNQSGVKQTNAAQQKANANIAKLQQAATHSQLLNNAPAKTATTTKAAKQTAKQAVQQAVTKVATPKPAPTPAVVVKAPAPVVRVVAAPAPKPAPPPPPPPKASGGKKR